MVVVNNDWANYVDYTGFCALSDTLGATCPSLIGILAFGIIQLEYVPESGFVKTWEVFFKLPIPRFPFFKNNDLSCSSSIPVVSTASNTFHWYLYVK